MSIKDLQVALDSSHTLYTKLADKIQKHEIINIYTVDNELIKIGSGSKIKKEDVISITPDYLTIRYDSHTTDIMYTGIKKIEYFSGYDG